jgi:hypothetical protein
VPCGGAAGGIDAWLGLASRWGTIVVDRHRLRCGATPDALPPSRKRGSQRALGLASGVKAPRLEPLFPPSLSSAISSQSVSSSNWRRKRRKNAKKPPTAAAGDNNTTLVGNDGHVCPDRRHTYALLKEATERQRFLLCRQGSPKAKSQQKGPVT